MKKIIAFSFFILMHFVSFGVFAQPLWNSLEVGKDYILSTKGILVRTNNPNESISSRPIAKLPKDIKVRVLLIDKDWAYVTWYSSANKKYKNGWVASSTLLIYSKIFRSEEWNDAFSRYSGAGYQASHSFEKAQKALANADYESAHDYIDEVLHGLFIISENATSNSDYISSAYMLKGIIYASQELFKKSIDCFNEAIYYDKNCTYAYTLRAFAYWKLGYYSKAKQDFIYSKNKFVVEGNQKKVIELNGYIKELDKLIILSK